MLAVCQHVLDKRLEQAGEGIEVLHTLPGPLTSSRTPSVDAGAGCRVTLGEPGIPSGTVHL